MSPSTERIYDFSAVEPSDVYRYLQENGWREKSKIDNRASILTITVGDKIFSTLLPLEKKIPDFYSRMSDVFRVLEVVEKRPKSEIFQSLVDVDSVALNRDREVLSLKFKFIDNPHNNQFSARQMGMILTSLQDLCDAVGQAETGNYSHLGKIKEEITDRTELSVFETFKGSFGVKLALAPNVNVEQLSFLERPLAERVAAQFLELIKRSDRVDKDALKKLLLRLQRRAASCYRKFLVSLIGTKANFDVAWGSVNPNGGGRASLSFENTITTVDFINKMEEENPEEYQIIGELLSASKSKNTLEIESQEDSKKYSGQISESVANNPDVELTIGRLYSATFQERTSINPATGEEKIERTVIVLSYIDSEN